MKLFSSKANFNDINTEVLRVLLKEYKVHVRSGMSDLEKA